MRFTKKINEDDIYLVYAETPTFAEGELVKILDYDSNDKSYAVAPLSDVYKFKGNIGRLLENSAKWVKPDNMTKLSYVKPSKFNSLYKVLALLGSLASGYALGSFIGF